MSSIHIKLSKCVSVTSSHAPIHAPSHSPITPLRFEMLIISAYKVPSTPTLHTLAAWTIKGIITSCRKNDSATLSPNTIQKYGNVFETTKNCVDLKIAAPKMPTITTMLGDFSSRRRLNVNVESKSDSDEATVIHEKSMAVYSSSRRKK